MSAVNTAGIVALGATMLWLQPTWLALVLTLVVCGGLHWLHGGGR